MQSLLVTWFNTLLTPMIHSHSPTTNNTSCSHTRRPWCSTKKNTWRRCHRIFKQLPYFSGGFGPKEGLASPVNYIRPGSITKKHMISFAEDWHYTRHYGRSTMLQLSGYEKWLLAVEMKKEDDEKTVSTTGATLWQFTATRFDLCNAPALLT